MICVLDVTAGPARGKRFWLRSHQQLEVGRISSADFAVPSDPHMSRRHLILEGTVSAFRLRDVGSANGTYVNNAKVSAVELCSGDQIRAGETTFEVSVLDDDDNPHASDGLTFSARASAVVPPPDAPVRIVSMSSQSETDEEATRRCRVPTPSPVESLNLRASSKGTMLSDNTWWSDYDFRVSDVPCLLDEISERSDKSSLLPEMLRRLEAEFSVTAIVDVERLGRFGRQQVGILVEQGLVTWHAPNVCTILNDRGRDFMRMVESGLERDALILIGARTLLDSHWLAELAHQVTRPSVLNAMLREPTSELTNQLLSTVEFVVFEHDRQGHLSLLLRDLVELSD